MRPMGHFSTNSPLSACKLLQVLPNPLSSNKTEGRAEAGNTMSAYGRSCRHDHVQLLQETKQCSNTDFFGSHNWGSDEQGQDNHKRAKLLFETLRGHGFNCWLDDGMLTHTGNAQGLHSQICKGVDDATLFVCCITRNYLRKVRDGNPDGKLDNCQAEFNYAINRKNQKYMVALVMEPWCLDTSNWSGPVGMSLGTKLYIDFTDNSKLTSACSELAKAFWGLVPKGTCRIDGTSTPQVLGHVPAQRVDMTVTDSIQKLHVSDPPAQNCVPTLQHASKITLSFPPDVPHVYAIGRPLAGGQPNLVRLSERVGKPVLPVVRLLSAKPSDFRVGDECAIRRSDGRLSIAVVLYASERTVDFVVETSVPGSEHDVSVVQKTIPAESIPGLAFRFQDNPSHANLRVNEQFC